MAKDINGVEIPTFAQATAIQDQQIASAAPKYTVAHEGALIPVDNESDVATAALSNNFDVNPNELFNVKKFDGSIGQVKGLDLQKVLASGDYMLESKEETQNREDEAKYGDKNIEAASLGAARGLSFGLSDQFLKHGGFKTGEELRGTEAANPVASIGGEVVGALAPAVLSGGSSLLAKGASKIGAGVIASERLGAAAARGVEGFAARQAEKATIQKIASEAGQKLAASEANTVALVASEASSGTAMLSEKAAEGASSVFTKSLEKAGYAAGTAKSIANRMLYSGIEHLGTDAANLAVQGALQGAGRLVTEDAFGTADFNAENLLSYAGIGALVGGTFGAAVGAGKALVPKAADLLKPVANKIEEFGGQLLDPERAALRMSEISPSQLPKIEARQPSFIKDHAEISKEILEKNPSIKSTADYNEAALKELENRGVKISDVLETSDKLAEANRPGLLQSVDTLQRKLMRAKDIFVERVAGGSTPKELEAIHSYADHYITGLQRLGADVPVTSKLMQAEKAVLANKAFKAAIPTSEELSIKGLQKEFASVYSKEQEQIVRGASEFHQSVDNLSESYLKQKKAYQTLANGTKNSEKIIAKEFIDPAHWDDVGVKDVAAAVTFGGPIAIAVKLARMAYDTNAVQKRIVMGSFDNAIRSAKIATAKGLNAMAKGTTVLAKAAEPSIVRSLVSSELAVKNEDGKRIKPKNEQEAYENIVNNASVAVTDPERVLQHSNKQTSAMFEHAPNTASAIDAKYLQTLQFLASKGKKSNKDKGLFDFKSKQTVSGFETAKMARYLDAIVNPNSMLDKASKGKLSREHVEVMKSIFPEMHNAMKTQTLDFISKNKTSLKYSQKLQLGLLLDMQAHESMQPQNIQALQGLFQPAAPEAADANYNPNAVGDMSKSSTLQSDLGDSVGDDN